VRAGLITIRTTFPAPSRRRSPLRSSSGEGLDLDRLRARRATADRVAIAGLVGQGLLATLADGRRIKATASDACAHRARPAALYELRSGASR